MKFIYAFNGDADGLCALHQLRLAAGPGGQDVLVTGVKRDIALLEKVHASQGDECTALDISLDVNRKGLLTVLAAGATVRYFDHHFAGEIPQSAKLDLPRRVLSPFPDWGRAAHRCGHQPSSQHGA